MARRNVSLKGVSELTMKLKSNANMKDVKQIVKQNTAELTQGAQRKAPVDTGNLRRSITMDLSDGGGLRYRFYTHLTSILECTPVWT